MRNALLWLHGYYMGFVLGDSLGTKPCVFSCKMAPAGDERYLECAAGAAGVVCVFFFAAVEFWLQAVVDALVYAQF